MYKNLSLENYLRVLQRSYFFLYKVGALRLKKEYAYHYFTKRLVRPGDVVIDIGANLGYYSILFAKWTGRNGKVVGVEPMPIYNKIYNELAAPYKNIVLHPYALGDESKDIKMAVPLTGGYLHTGLPHVKENNVKAPADQIHFDARMVTPSQLFGSLPRIDYIKCDVEGYEYHVLSDMEDIIRKHMPTIHIEVCLENVGKVKDLLYSMGYNQYILKKGRLSKLSETDVFNGGDCIYIPDGATIDGIKPLQ